MYIEWPLRLTETVCQLHLRLAEFILVQAILSMLLTCTLSMPLIYNLSEAFVLFITLDYTNYVINYVLVIANSTNASDHDSDRKLSDELLLSSKKRHEA